MIIGISGLMGSGKDTVGSLLVQYHGFQSVSFASALKDAVSSVFGWERDLLEGKTEESRKFRETVDLWWSKKLAIPHLTPRWVLQHWGTDVLRDKFHQDIWILSLERKILSNENAHFVITDCRFKNELRMLRNNNALLVRIRRGEDPAWFCFARQNQESMKHAFPEIHNSEYDWADFDFDFEIDNCGSYQDLVVKVNNLVSNLQTSSQLRS